MNITKTTITEYEISCDQCGKSESIRDDDGSWMSGDTAIKFFKRYGWKQVQGQTLCQWCRGKEE